MKSDTLGLRILKDVFRETLRRIEKDLPLFRCPICDWPFLDEDPKLETFDICPQCGVEFGYETAGHSYEELRAAWLKLNKPFWLFEEDSELIPCV